MMTDDVAIFERSRAAGKPWRKAAKVCPILPVAGISFPRFSPPGRHERALPWVAPSLA
jgi:hypothetical protein